jgi:uncharacterized protein
MEDERTVFTRTQFDQLRGLIEAMPMANGFWHGSQHWMHEAWTGMNIADADPRVDRGLVLIFAMIHDTHRVNEGRDPSHGQRAAEFAERINDSILKLPPEKLRVLMEACIEHDRGMITEDPTVGACWDSDRLQLKRVGITPHPKYLSTAVGKTLIQEATAFRGHPLTWDDVFRKYEASPSLDPPISAHDRNVSRPREIINP